MPARTRPPRRRPTSSTTRLSRRVRPPTATPNSTDSGHARAPPTIGRSWRCSDDLPRLVAKPAEARAGALGCVSGALRPCGLALARSGGGRYGGVPREPKRGASSCPWHRLLWFLRLASGCRTLHPALALPFETSARPARRRPGSSTASDTRSRPSTAAGGPRRPTWAGSGATSSSTVSAIPPRWGPGKSRSSSRRSPSSVTSPPPPRTRRSPRCSSSTAWCSSRTCPGSTTSCAPGGRSTCPSS